MKALLYFLENKFAPTMNKFAENPWIQTISGSIMLVLPTILLGSAISVYNVLRGYFPALPDAQPLFSFSFGLYSLILSFLIGYHGMTRFKNEQYKLAAGIIGLSTFIMMIKPTIENGQLLVEFSRFGPKGILVSFVAGILTLMVVNIYAKIDPFGNNTTIPEFLINWINQMIPAFIVLLISMILVIKLDLDIFLLVTKLFEPVNKFGQSYFGFLIIAFLPAFFYSLGISSWLLSPVYSPIMLAGITENIEAIAQGLPVLNIVTQETVFVGYLWIGGMGATLPLVLLMMRAKSKKLRTLGKVTLVPSLFNINEPVIYGAPIAFNPLLMPPMWINAIVGATTIWLFMTNGLVNIPAKLLTGVKLPMPISSVLVSEDWRGIILWAVLFAVFTLVWYPFFKTYDNQLVEEENNSKK